MLQKIDAKNWLDEDGNPTGGEVLGVGIDINWQNGPLGRGPDRVKPNGAFVEGVIQAAIQRLQYFQEASNGKFKCRENAIAITHLETALAWLCYRHTLREQREVDGTHTP